MMVGPKDHAQRSATQWFGEQLRAAMHKAGYRSDRSRTGIDPAPLAQRLKVTYEMGRRYVEGLALPKSAKRRAIERWLRLPDYALEPPEHGKVNEIAADYMRPREIREDAPELIEERVPPPKDSPGEAYGYDINLLSSCALAVTEALHEQDIELDREQAAQVVARLYQEAVSAERRGKEADMDSKSVVKLVIDVLKGRTRE